MRRIDFITLLYGIVAVLLITVVPVRADDDSLESLGFIEKSSEELVSTPRFPRPISKIAENITVITAADIERLNAHTLADVLQTVPGIQFDYMRTPSAFSFFNIQGALNTTILVLMDGVRQNDFDQNMAQPGLIPVQQIERVEIIKGSASAAWGPALGGVINIITKSPDPSQKAGGMVSGSIGSRVTADTRAELNGTLDRFGYYLTAGHLNSNGLTPNTGTALNNIFGKVVYTLPDNGTATLGLWHLNARPGTDEGNTASWGFVHDNNEYRRTNGFLKYSQPLGAALRLDIDGYLTNRDDHAKYGGPNGAGAIIFFNDYAVRDTSRGASARLNWGDSEHSLATGVEYGHANASFHDLLNPPTPGLDYDRTWDSWGLYVNGAWTIGKLTLLPGVRLDLTGINSDTTSYTMGATYQLGESTTLRTYAAQGFALPMPRAQNNGLQKIKTVQAGIESGALPYVWLKGTYFYNTLRNSVSGGAVTVTNQDRQGFEIEGRTTPFYNLSLSSGYSYLFATNSDSGERLKTDSQGTVPPHIVKLALNYDDAKLGLRGTLTGNYVWWNAAPTSQASDQGMIWDLHLNWKIKPSSELSPELFFSGHNLFNGNQTTDTELFSSAKRWYEGGVRVSF